MLVFMHKYINRIVDVKRDDNIKFHDVSTFVDFGEENHTLVRQNLIREHPIRKTTQGYTGKNNNMMKFMMP